MRYELPRYIEEEAKIAGPLSVKQFFIFLGGGIACALYFYFLKVQVAFPLSVITLGGLGAVVFGKYKGRPISGLIISVLKYVWFPHTYVWEKPDVRQQDLFRETRKVQEEHQEVSQESKVVTPERLRDIAQELDKKQ